jgi:hypothetical protein
MTLPAVAQSLRGWFRCSALLLLLIVPLAGCDLCGNDVLARYRAPDTSVEVVVFQRDCGATTGFSTQASIGEINAGTGNRPGNIFRAVCGRAPAGKGGGPELRVRWIDNRTVELAYHRAADVLRKPTEHRGIKIRYATFE